MSKSNVASDEKWVRAQTKAFTHWVNIALGKRSIRIESLQEGLNNGINLINLAEILTGQNLTKKYSTKPALRVHKINNCFMGLDHLKDPNIGNMKNLTISAENIVDGELTLLLGFCWTLLRKFSDLGDGGKGGKSNSYEQGLLDWVKTALSGSQYSDIHGLLCDNFNFKSEAFKNGKVFLGLLNELSPGTIDYSSYSTSTHLDNCKAALSLSETRADVPAIIDPEDLASGNASEKELVLYLSLWYKMFKEKQINVSGEALNKKMVDMDTQLKVLTEENEALRLANQALQSSIEEDSERLARLKREQDELQLKLTEEMETQLRETRDKLDQEKDEKEREIARLKESVQLGGQSSEKKMEGMQQNIKDTDAEREKLLEEMAALKAQWDKEKDDLEKQNAALEKSIAQHNKDRQALEQKFQQKQQTEGKHLFNLRKDMYSHLNDMNNWKVFLNQQGMTYESEELHLTMEEEVASLEHSKRVQSVATYVSEEDAKLVKLHEKSKEPKAKKEVPPIDGKKSSKKSSSSKK